MIGLIVLIVFNLVVLGIAFKTERFLYTKSPEEQWQPIISKFDENLKSIEDLDTSDYKLGSGHVY